jgi:uncharacterized protein DUF5343
MPLSTGETAPYAPPATVMQVITAFRDRGLSTPITSDVLLRASINESLVPRTLRSLELLELIDDAGNPTPALEGLRRATAEDFRKRLEELVRGVYAEVFKFVDPATDDLGRVADAFRAFNPIGQRGRMVTLFMGLCEAAGIVPEGTRKAPPGTSRPISTKRKVTTAQPPRGPSVKYNVRSDDGGMVPEPLLGLLRALPANGSGWTQARRNKFVDTFEAVLDFTIPVHTAGQGDDLEDET